MLLNAEAWAARGNDGARELLQDLSWREHFLPRLCLAMLELDMQEQAIDLVQGLCVRWPVEKPIENCFQYMRDAQRHGRKNTAPSSWLGAGS